MPSKISQSSSKQEEESIFFMKVWFNKSSAIAVIDCTDMLHLAI